MVYIFEVQKVVLNVYRKRRKIVFMRLAKDGNCDSDKGSLSKSGKVCLCNFYFINIIIEIALTRVTWFKSNITKDKEWGLVILWGV